MELTWQGGSTVTIKGNKAQVVVNPQAEQMTEDNILIFSDEQKKVKKGLEVFDWPGEYELKGVAITCLQAYTKPKGEAGANPTLISKFEVDGIQFCHLGELGHDLEPEMIEKLGNVDVLIFVDNGNLSLKKLHSLLEEMEPRALAPLASDNLDVFFKEMGSAKPEAVKSYTIKGDGQFSEDKRDYIVLEQA